MWLNFFIVVLYIYIEMFITAGNRILSIFQNFVITICLPNHMFMLTVHKYNLKIIRYRKWNLLRSKIRAAWLGFEPTTPIFRQYSPLFPIELCGLLAVQQSLQYNILKYKYTSVTTICMCITIGARRSKNLKSSRINFLQSKVNTGVCFYVHES